LFIAEVFVKEEVVSCLEEVPFLEASCLEVPFSYLEAPCLVEEPYLEEEPFLEVPYLEDPSFLEEALSLVDLDLALVVVAASFPYLVLRHLFLDLQGQVEVAMLTVRSKLLFPWVVPYQVHP
jgi:hypothetical protein